MKRLLCLLLALVLLSGCVPQSLVRNEKTVQFYYQSKNPDYFSPLGILGPEARTLRASEDTVEGLMERYLDGHMSQELEDPFDKGLKLVRAEEVSQREITLTFDDSLASLTGIKLSLFCACVARTLADYRGYEVVNFRAENAMLEGDRESIAVRPAELVLEDHSAGHPNAMVMLYFASADGRYLIGESISVPAEENDDLPAFVVRKLLEGPQSDALQPTIPAGTMLQNVVSVVDRVCVVNFSEEFRTNRPQTALSERMTIFSLVNSLTKLDEVDSVDIMIEGRKEGRYLNLDLSGELTADERLIGPVRSGAGELDATLYVCLEGSEKLAAFPMRVESPSDAIKKLCEFQEANGYYSPAKDLVQEYEMQEDGSIKVMLRSDSADETQLRLAERSVIATVADLPEELRLQLYVDGVLLDQSAVPLPDSWREDWILP